MGTRVGENLFFTENGFFNYTDVYSRLQMDKLKLWAISINSRELNDHINSLQHIVDNIHDAAIEDYESCLDEWCDTLNLDDLRGDLEIDLENASSKEEVEKIFKEFAEIFMKNIKKFREVENKLNESRRKLEDIESGVHSSCRLLSKKPSQVELRLMFEERKVKELDCLDAPNKLPL